MFFFVFVWVTRATVIAYPSSNYEKNTNVYFVLSIVQSVLYIFIYCRVRPGYYYCYLQLTVVFSKYNVNI